MILKLLMVTICISHLSSNISDGYNATYLEKNSQNEDGFIATSIYDDNLNEDQLFDVE